MPEEITALQTQESANAEDAPIGAGSDENLPAGDSRTYTQEEFEAALEAAVKERTAGAIRERVDRANKQKKELSSENKELADQVRSLTAKLEEFQSREQIRELTEKIAKETGVPADLLRGNTEEELTAHAEAPKGYIDKPSAPFVGSDGFAAGNNEQRQNVQDKFAETIEDLLNR